MKNYPGLEYTLSFVNSVLELDLSLRVLASEHARVTISGILEYSSTCLRLSAGTASQRTRGSASDTDSVERSSNLFTCGTHTVHSELHTVSLSVGSTMVQIPLCDSEKPAAAVDSSAAKPWQVSLIMIGSSAAHLYCIILLTSCEYILYY